MSVDGGLRQEFRKRLPDFHWTSIESGLTAAGIPDSNYCKDGVEGWVEFKLTSSFRVRIDPFQVAWHERRFRARGLTFLAVRYQHGGGPRKGAPIDSLYVYRGDRIRAVFREGLSVTPELVFPGGPSAWRWSEVGQLLLTKA